MAAENASSAALPLDLDGMCSAERFEADAASSSVDRASAAGASSSSSTTAAASLDAPRQLLYELTLVPQELQERAMALFHQMDEDGDGLISVLQLEAVMKRIGLTYSQTFQDITAEMAADPSTAPAIDLNEFSTILRTVMAAENPQNEQGRVREAFETFDKDGDGQLSLRELQDAMKNISIKYSDEQVADMFREIDTDGSGSVDYEEFTKYIAKR